MNELRRCIETLEAAIGDASRGLPEEIFRFVSRIVPLVNVDLLIQDERSRTLLTWREDEYFGTGWHVPGGIIRYKESAADRIRACAREELGAEVSADGVPLAVVESIATQATRGHHVALLFRCTLRSPLDQSMRASSDAPLPGQWRWHDRCPPNLLDLQKSYTRFF